MVGSPCVVNWNFVKLNFDYGLYAGMRRCDGVFMLNRDLNILSHSSEDCTSSAEAVRSKAKRSLVEACEN